MIAPAPPTNYLLDAALEYASIGWCVFPLAPGGKTPLIPKRDGGRGFLDATTDAQRIREWWTRNPTANIGLATGRASGFDVLDVDGPEGETSLTQIEAEHGPLPTTLVAITPHGRHVYFANRSGLRNRANYPGRPGIDIRTDGGYVVAPPSVVDGKPYTFSIGA